MRRQRLLVDVIGDAGGGNPLLGQRGHQLPYRVDDLLAPAVPHGQGEAAAPPGAGLFQLLGDPYQLVGKQVEAADEAHRGIEAIGERSQAAKQLHQHLEVGKQLLPGPGQVLGRQQPAGDGRNLQLLRPAEELLELAHPHSVAGGVVGQTLGSRVAAVPVQDDPDVARQPGAVQGMAQPLLVELVDGDQEPVLHHRPRPQCYRRDHARSTMLRPGSGGGRVQQRRRQLYHAGPQILAQRLRLWIAPG